MHVDLVPHPKAWSVPQWLRATAAWVAVPLLYFVTVALTAPIADPRELDYDEGVNLVKALLLGRGFTLYSQIWSDQPPLFTDILERWLAWFGQSVTAARFLVLLFSALLLWSFFQLARRSVSWPAALAATVALVLSEEYVRLSISVMIGVPALALAMLSVYLFVVASDTSRPWLMAASGLVMAASLQIKLITVLVALPLAAYLALDLAFCLRARRNIRASLGPAIAWSAALIAGFVAIALLTPAYDLDQILGTHAVQQAGAAFELGENVRFLWQAFVRHAPLILLALAGAVWAIRRRLRLALLPGAWLAITLAALLYQKSLHYHYVMLLAIPLAWLAAFGIDGCIAAFTRIKNSHSVLAPSAGPGAAVGAVALIAFMIVEPSSLQLRLPKEVLHSTPTNDWVLSRLCPGGQSGQDLMWSDRPYYAFISGLSEPPGIAVVTGDRFASGKVAEPDILAKLEAAHPRYVLLERFRNDYTPGFLAELDKTYQLIATYQWGPPEEEPARFLVARTTAGGAAGETEQAVFRGWLGLSWTHGTVPAKLTAGQCLGIGDLSWSRPEDTLPPDLALSLRLLDGSGETWFQHDEWLANDWNTLKDRTSLSSFINPLLPEGTPPGDYSVALIVYDRASGEPLTVSHDGEPESGGLILGRVQVSRPSVMPSERPAVADFGAIRLIRATTSASTVSPGDTVPVSLLWQAAPGYEPDQYVVVAQLLNERGNVVAALEEEPLGGRYGTNCWQPGELVLDRHGLQVPAGVARGSYTLIVGLYRASDRSRLRAPSGFLGLSSTDRYDIGTVAVK